MGQRVTDPGVILAIRIAGLLSVANSFTLAALDFSRAGMVLDANINFELAARTIDAIKTALAGGTDGQPS